MMKKILLKMNLPNGDPNNKNLKKLINLEITIMIVIIIEKINIMEINNLLIDQRISIQEMINMTKIQIIMTEVMMIILTEDVIITTTTQIIMLKTMMISITKNMIEITTGHKDLPLLREVEAEEEEGQVEEVITKVTMIEDMIILKTELRSLINRLIPLGRFHSRLCRIVPLSLLQIKTISKRLTSTLYVCQHRLRLKIFPIWKC